MRERNTKPKTPYNPKPKGVTRDTGVQQVLFGDKLFNLRSCVSIRTPSFITSNKNPLIEESFEMEIYEDHGDTLKDLWGLMSEGVIQIRVYSPKGNSYFRGFIASVDYAHAWGARSTSPTFKVEVKRG